MRFCTYVALVSLSIILTSGCRAELPFSSAPLPSSQSLNLSGELTGRIVFDSAEELPETGLIALVNLTTLPPGIPTMSQLDERIIAKGTIIGSRTSPVSFTILYDPSSIDPRQHYAVLVDYTWREGEGLASRGVSYTNAYEDGYNPARVFTHNYPSNDIEVKITVIYVIS